MFSPRRLWPPTSPRCGSATSCRPSAGVSSPASSLQQMGGWWDLPCHYQFFIKILFFWPSGHHTTATVTNLIFARSFKHKASQRRSEDSERAERREAEEESSVLESLDSKAVATILRGLAEAADNWDEL